MDDQHYNSDKIIQITLFDFSDSSCIIFKKFKKRLFGFMNVKEGYYYRSICENEYLGTECPKYHILKNGEVQKLPHVKIKFQDDYEHCQYFETLNKAKSFYNKITKDKKFIRMGD